MFKIGKSLKLENRFLVARARVRGNKELMLKDNMFIFIIMKIEKAILTISKKPRIYKGKDKY